MLFLLLVVEKFFEKIKCKINKVTPFYTISIQKIFFQKKKKMTRVYHRI